MAEFTKGERFPPSDGILMTDLKNYSDEDEEENSDDMKSLIGKVPSQEPPSPSQYTVTLLCVKHYAGQYARQHSVVAVAVALIMVLLVVLVVVFMQNTSSVSIDSTVNQSNPTLSLPSPPEPTMAPFQPTLSPTEIGVAPLPAYPLPSDVDFADLPSTLQKCAQPNDVGGRCFLFSVRGSGLASQLMNAFVNQLYVRDVWHRDIFIIDETNFNSGKHYEAKHASPNHPTNRTTFGIMTAYFTPTTLAVLAVPEVDRPLVNQTLQQSTSPTVSLEDWYELDYQAQSDYATLGFTDESPLWLANFHTFQSTAGQLAWIHPNGDDSSQTDWWRLYKALVDAMCPNLQFNDITWQAIQTRRNLYDFPVNFYGNPQNGEYTVGFHVRRTDKLKHESKLYPASDYVKKLLQSLPLNVPQSSITQCFLATDDYAVVQEMQQALDKWGLRCQLHYTPTSAFIKDMHPGSPKQRFKAKATEIFLTEVSMLMEATFFVGTFNSNVGGLVAVLRACPIRQAYKQAGHDGSDHFARSYGVGMFPNNKYR